MKLQLKQFSIYAYAQGDKRAEKCALILPGFLDTKDYLHMRSHVDSLAEQGFYALAIDFPGTWQTGGEIADYTITNCEAVILEILSQLNRPTLLAGHSNGGRLALQAASKSRQVIGVVAIMPPLHIIRTTSDTHIVRIQRWKTEGVRTIRMDLANNSEQIKVFKVPYTFLLNSEKYPVTDFIGSVSQPKLFIAGKRDHVIVPSEVDESFRLCADPKKFTLIDAGHNYRNEPKAVTKVNHLIKDFAKQFL